MTECIERVHERGAPVPGGYRAETSDNDRAATARLAGGLFFFGSYGAAYAVALSMPSQLSWLYVPLVGPWGALGKANLFEQDLTVKALLVTDGAMQAAGAILWLSGYLLRGEQLLRLSADSVQSATLGQVYVAPVRTEDGFGVNVGGLF
jgi:hypothetical protein